MNKIILSEDNELKRKEDTLLEDSKKVLEDIKYFVNELKTLDGEEFNNILKILHGRFSKLELTIIDLEKL